MKAIIQWHEVKEKKLDLTPLEPGTKVIGGVPVVDLPPRLINALQKADADRAVAEKHIMKHLTDTGQVKEVKK